MISPIQYPFSLIFICSLIFQNTYSLSLQERRDFRSIKRRNERMGQKEVVEDYEVGNNRHLMEQLLPLKAFLTQQLKEHGNYKDLTDGKHWIFFNKSDNWRKVISNNFIEHRRKRDIGYGKKERLSSEQDKQIRLFKTHKLTKRNDDKDDKSSEESKELFKDKEDYDDFFRNEYYRILAQSFASTRKKREAQGNSEDNEKFGKMERSLDNIEDLLISEALDSVQNKNLQNIKETIETAYDVKKIRSSLQHLKATLDKIDNTKNEEKKKQKDYFKNEDEKRDGTLPKSSRVHFSDPSPLWNEHSTEENGHIQPQNAGFRPLPGFSTRPILTNDVLIGKWKFFNDDKYDHECPSLHLLAKDCSTLGDIMPEGNLRNVLLRACNWLEICYACGRGYDLQSDDCDTGFLYGIRSVCEGDIPCQATGRLLFLSLRQTSVSRRSLPSVCHTNRCVEQFLRQLTTR